MVGCSSSDGTGGATAACPTPSLRTIRSPHPIVRRRLRRRDEIGPGGHDKRESDRGGLQFNVHTPSAYSATVGHPLIVVFAAAGTSARRDGAVHGACASRDGEGVRHRLRQRGQPTVTRDIQQAALVVPALSARWCIDAARVYYTGHSAGGSMPYALLLNNLGPRPPRSPRAAPASMPAALAQVQCLGYRLPAMVLHSAQDELFPRFGSDAATWWVTCNGCDAGKTTQQAGGCISYSGCRDGVDVQYCETAGLHHVWTNHNAEMLAFFARFRAP